MSVKAPAKRAKSKSKSGVKAKAAKSKAKPKGEDGGELSELAQSMVGGMEAFSDAIESSDDAPEPSADSLEPSDDAGAGTPPPASGRRGRRAARAVDSVFAIREAAQLLKQASDPTRLYVLLTLADSPLNVGALCSLVGMAQPAMSHHLALLRHGRLVDPERSAKTVVYSLTDTGRALVEVVRGLIV